MPGLILYLDENSEKSKSLKEIMSKVAPKVSGKLQCVVTEIKEGLPARLAEYIGIKDTDLPTVRIADTRIDLKKI